jgi:signal peptidase I
MKKVKFKENPIKWLNKEIFIPLALAIVVIQFVIQAFKIPSQSMEDTLLVGDFLLGLKFVYGSPLPFSESRLPSMIEPDTGDIVIFRYPGEPAYPDYDQERYSHLANLLILGNYYWDHQPEEGQPHLVSYFQGPKDFIKRVVAKSGQTIEVKKKKFYIDGEFHEIPGKGKNTTTSERMFLDNYGPIRLPAPGETYRLDTLSLIELHRLKSLILQENPSSTVHLDLNLKVNGKVNNQFVWSPLTGTPFYRPASPEAMNSVYTSDIYSDAQKENFLRASEVRNGEKSFEVHYKQPLYTGFYPDFQYHDQKTTFGMRQVSYMYFVDPMVEELAFNLKSYRDLYKLKAKELISNFLANSPSGTDTLFSKATQLNDSLQLLPDSLKAKLKVPQFEIETKVLVDGQEIQDYTIQEDVFFMAGDNRDNSSDSRVWGFLSRRNVKAKAFIIYMSIDAQFTAGQHPQERAAGYKDVVKDNEIRITNPFTWLKLPFLIRWTRIGKLIHGV